MRPAGAGEGALETVTEKRLALLAECGVNLVQGKTKADVVSELKSASAPRDLKLLMATLGDGLSNELWHFDTECIEDHGDYANLARRLAALAGDALPLHRIADHVDLEKGSAWLEFELDGKRHRWKARVEDDWVDPEILSKFAALLRDRRAGKQFTYFDLGGQDCVLGAATPPQFECLRKQLGADFSWLQ